MVDVRPGQLLEEPIKNDSIVIFENTGGLTKRDVGANLRLGENVQFVRFMSDFPPEINGFVTLEQNVSYTIIANFNITSPILFPAGWIGFINSSFLNEFDNLYTGAGTMFNTLNIDGDITAVADAGAGAITVTSAAHGLLDGQFVNITGTTSYNKQRLVISNVTTNTFDVQIAFVASETGTFDTGFELIEIKDIGFQNAAAADLFDLTGDNSGASALVTTTVLAVGFLSPGIIRNAINMVFDNSGFTFFTTGITLENCDTIRIGPTQLISLVGGPGAIALTMTGSGTNRALIDNLTFFLSDPGEFAVRIDPSIGSTASITIQNSPDNSVATDYFDLATGGLDQTDPRVISLNNGSRENSMTLAEARTNGVLEVDGSGGIDVPIVDITPVSGDWIQDPSTEEFTVNTTTGLVTYIGLRPISVKIEYSLSASQTSGGNQTIEFDLHISGVTQVKTLRTLVTSGTGSPLPIAYAGGNFNIDTGDTFQIFKDNMTNTTNTDIQDGTILITRN